MSSAAPVLPTIAASSCSASACTREARTPAGATAPAAGPTAAAAAVAVAVAAVVAVVAAVAVVATAGERATAVSRRGGASEVGASPGTAGCSLPRRMSSRRRRRSSHALAGSWSSGAIRAHSRPAPPPSTGRGGRADAARSRASTGASCVACAALSTSTRAEATGEPRSLTQRSWSPPCSARHQSASRSSMVSLPPVE